MNRKEKVESHSIKALTILIIVIVFLLGFSTAFGQTVYVQGTDWVGNRYVISYPINTDLNSFNARYDRAGINYYYTPPAQRTNVNVRLKQKPISRKPKTNPYTVNPYNFNFKPTKEFWDNTGVFDKD